jgi:hypothetical protein
MTKFANKTFSVALGSKAYQDNWDAVFGEKNEYEALAERLGSPIIAEDLTCAHCHGPRQPNPPWPRGFCCIECERAFYKALGD